MSDHIGQYNPREGDPSGKTSLSGDARTLWSKCGHPPLFIGESHAFKARFSLIDLTIVS